jgi:hypothetical protein
MKNVLYNTLIELIEKYHSLNRAEFTVDAFDIALIVGHFIAGAPARLRTRDYD